MPLRLETDAEIIAEVNVNETKIDTVDTVVDGIQTDLSNATDGLGALKALIDAVQTDVGNPTGEVLASISAKIGDIARSLDVIIGTRWDSAGDIGTDIAQVLTYTDILDNATNGLANIKSLIDTVFTVADGIQTDLSNATDGLGALKALIDTIDTVVNGIQTDLSNATDGLGALKALIDTVTSELAEVPKETGTKTFNSTALAAIQAEVESALEDAGQVIVTTTIATLASQTSFTLTAGSADNDAYNGMIAVIEDVSTATQKAIGIISDYVGATKTIALREDPGIFIMAATDKISIKAVSPDILNILADTNELQTDWANGGRLDLLLDAIPTTAMRGTDSAALASVLGALNTAAATGAVTTTDEVMAYVKQLVTLLLEGTYGLSALQTLLAAITAAGPTKTEMDTAHGLLATPAQVATALTNYDAPTKAEMDTGHGLLATPAQVATALTNYDPPTKGEMDTGHALLATVAKQNRVLCSMDFWSEMAVSVTVTGAQSTITTGLNNVVVADLPDGATVVRAIAMMKFRMVENTYAGVNKLDAAAALPIQLDDVGNTGMLTCLDFADDLFTLAASTREGGDVYIGDNDVAARVDGNDTYDFQWLNAKADQANIVFNDVQMGIRIWYSV